MRNNKLATLLIAVTTAVAVVLPVSSLASGGHVKLESANIDLNDHKSLQNGAKYYMNYCFGCHGLSASRYNRVANDIGFPVDPVAVKAAGLASDDAQANAMADANTKLLNENLIFTTNDKGKAVNPGTLMTSAIPAKDASKWFGAPPPDLSLVGRSRGSDWIYTYLKSFYLDPKRPTGVNNTTFHNVGMPHVLWELQGWQTLGDDHKSLTLATSGSLSPVEYDGVIRDLTNFLTYVSEPAQLHRTKYGIFAMLLLLVFIGVAYALKKEFWKDIH